jgi:hypothetical protein
MGLGRGEPSAAANGGGRERDWRLSLRRADRDARFRGQAGKHLLVLSLTGFDPKLTLALHQTAHAAKLLNVDRGGHGTPLAIRSRGHACANLRALTPSRLLKKLGR